MAENRDDLWYDLGMTMMFQVNAIGTIHERSN